jgi:hypothetical protein
MGNIIIIAGKSGTGKSTSMRNLDPEKTLLVNIIGKPLPFKGKGWKKVDTAGSGNIFTTDRTADIKSILPKASSKGFKTIIIDDAGYIMTNEFMRRVNEKGYDKFNDIAYNIWDLFEDSKKLPDDVNVYFTFHVEFDSNGNEGIKTIGRLLSDKVTIEGMATVVLISDRVDGKYIFRTQSNGYDIAKSPIGMFTTESIENDLKIVDDAIREFYQEE